MSDLSAFSQFVMTNAPIMQLENDDATPGADCSQDPAVFAQYVDRHLAKADAVVALGQALNKDGSVPKTLEFRAGATAALWKYATDPAKGGRSRFPIFCCGGDPVKTGTPESAHMKTLLVEKYGVKAEDVILEDQSTTTLENAYFVIDLLSGLRKETGSKPVLNVVLVSSEFHVPRALYCFDAVYEHCLAKEGEDAYKIRQWALPALSGCPETQTISTEDMGPGLNQRINEQTLAQRLMGERFFVNEEVVPNLAKHVKKGEIPIPALSEERHLVSKGQLEKMIQVVESNSKGA